MIITLNYPEMLSSSHAELAMVTFTSFASALGFQWLPASVTGHLGTRTRGVGIVKYEAARENMTGYAWFRPS